MPHTPPGDALQLPAPAKLNLFLHITGRRADGYHELQTLFQFLDYADQLSFIPRQDGKIQLHTPIDGVDHESNLIVRAARLLQAHSGCRLGADIWLDKQLPMGGGIGGGSSDAATTLVALNRLWQLNLDEETLAELGRQLGADVPVFVRGHAAFAEGVGERLQPVTVAEKWYLVLVPPVHVSTAAIFTDAELPRDTPKYSWAALQEMDWKNDCQALVKKRHPEVANALSWLLEYAPSRMTGTGACVFAEFATESAARKVLANAPNWLQGFVAQGVNLSPLRSGLQPVCA